MYSVLAVAAAGLALVNAQTPVPGVTGQQGDAKVVQGNPSGVTYIATLPDKNTTGIRGYVSATSSSNGTGVSISVNLYGFPSLADFGPFIYHIHDQPVPANGNCTATLAHLDPFIRGEMPPCLASAPATCQVGDLSGKHGNITTQAGLKQTYTDLYLSTKSGVGSFLGNRSIVVHTKNTTRLNCANFVLSTSGANGTTNGSTVSGTARPSSPSGTSRPSGQSFAGGAAANVVGATALFGVAAGVFAFFL